jgi:hypothetical protein
MLLGVPLQAVPDGTRRVLVRLGSREVSTIEGGIGIVDSPVMVLSLTDDPVLGATHGAAG